MEEIHHPSSTIHHLVLGTAGHIDHGKTALIKALTGVDTDRLREEKERGISIELGYAELELPSGTTMSIVDVPGHEKFVRNMVAGASGIDIFLLAVAADDGVMPQTREHMAVIQLLDIPQGVVAITKTDLVDPEMAELVQTEVEDFLAETPYAEAPVVPVSSKTGEGLPLLLGHLEEAASRASRAHKGSPWARLPIDRVFTLKGIGTVVTGTLWSGQICADDSLLVLPARLPARARSVQIHDRSVQCAEAGYRVAVNMSGIDREQLARGQMVTRGEGLETTYMVDARVRLLDSAPRLKYGAQVRFHHGTADYTAKLMFADRDRLGPGESCFAQIRLKKKIVPAPGDRFILRSLSPVNTIGGGVVIDPAPRKHGRGEEIVSRLDILEKDDPVQIIMLLLREAGADGISLEELKRRSHLQDTEIDAVLAGRELASTRESGDIVYLFLPEIVAGLEKQAIEALSEHQKKFPADPGMKGEELARSVGLPPAGPAFKALIGGLLGRGEIAQKQQRYLLPSAEAKLSPAQRGYLEAVRERLAKAGPAPPSILELRAATGAGDVELKLVLKLMEERGQAVRVKPDLFFAPAAVDNARKITIDWCQETGKITLAELRDRLGVSRKFAQALLEYFDRAGLTRRIEDYRVLRKWKADT